MGKLAQALVYGADIIQVKGNFDEALNLVKEAAERFPVTIVNSQLTPIGWKVKRQEP